MSGVTATTVFGAGDLQGLVSQLNQWTPQIELTLQELRGAEVVMSGQMQRLVHSAEIGLVKVRVSFQNELNARALEKAQSDESLKQDPQQLMIQVHQNFREDDTAISTISSMHAASIRTAPQRAPQAVSSTTAQPSQDPCAPTAAQPRLSDTTPQGGTPTPQGEAPTAPSQETEM